MGVGDACGIIVVYPQSGIHSFFKKAWSILITCCNNTKATVKWLLHVLRSF